MIEKIAIVSREQWLNARRQDVTASIAAALLDEHPYATPFELWALKKGKIGDPEDNAAMKRGRLLEPVVVELLREMHPDWKFEIPGVYLRDASRRLGATPDLYARKPDGRLVNIQIKTADYFAFKKNWLDRDTRAIDLPSWIALQCMIETELSLADEGMVAVLVIGNGLTVYEVPVERHAGLMRSLNEELVNFWRIFDSGEEMSPDYARDASAVKRVYDEGGEPARDLSGDNEFGAALDTREKVKMIIKEAKDALEVAETTIKSKMGNSDVATYGAKCVSWKLQSRAEHFAKASQFRVLRDAKHPDLQATKKRK